MRGFLGESLVGGRALQEIRRSETPLYGVWRKEVVRANPAGGYFPPSEVEVTPRLIVNDGMDFMAQRISSQATGIYSAMTHMVIGTGTVAATYTDLKLAGEVLRKVFGSVVVGSNMWVAVSTFGGGADSVTSVIIQEAGLSNTTVVNTGVFLDRAIFAQVVLASSDFLRLQIEVETGSRA